MRLDVTFYVHSLSYYTYVHKYAPSTLDAIMLES